MSDPTEEQAATEARRGLDVDVLARAIQHTWGGSATLTKVAPATAEWMRKDAERIAAEYRRLIEASDG
jgi:hypothetical protein